jgi:hypothetical protein
MTRSRISIGKMMVLIAVVAVDLVAIRQTLRENGVLLELAVVFGPMALALQVGLARVTWGKPECRPFWLGFESAGLLAVVYLGVAILTQLRIILMPIQVYEEGFKALLYEILLGRSPTLKQFILSRPALRMLYTSFYLSLLQVLMATVGGYAARSVARRRARRACRA